MNALLSATLINRRSKIPLLVAHFKAIDQAMPFRVLNDFDMARIQASTNEGASMVARQEKELLEIVG